MLDNDAKGDFRTWARKHQTMLSLSLQLQTVNMSLFTAQMRLIGRDLTLRSSAVLDGGGAESFPEHQQQLRMLEQIHAQTHFHLNQLCILGHMRDSLITLMQESHNMEGRLASKLEADSMKKA